MPRANEYRDSAANRFPVRGLMLCGARPEVNEVQARRDTPSLAAIFGSDDFIGWYGVLE